MFGRVRLDALVFGCAALRSYVELCCAVFCCRSPLRGQARRVYFLRCARSGFFRATLHGSAVLCCAVLCCALLLWLSAQHFLDTTAHLRFRRIVALSYRSSTSFQIH